MNEEQALAHRQTWDLIPWIVNGTATADDCRRVETHLNVCADCRDEYALQSQLHEGINVDFVATHNPLPALQRLLARIDASTDAELPSASAPWPAALRPAVRETRVGARWVQALVAAVVVQAIGLSLLGALLLERSPAGPASNSASYETLSSTPARAATASIRLVPAATLTIDSLRALLAESNLRIVESSGDNAILGLAPANGPLPPDSARGGKTFDVAAAVARLRAHSGVMLAEPIAASAGAPQ